MWTQDKNDWDYLNALKLFSLIFIKAIAKEMTPEAAASEPDRFIQVLNDIEIIINRLRTYILLPDNTGKMAFQMINEYCSSHFIQLSLACAAEIPEGETRDILLKLIDKEYQYRENANMFAMDGKISFSKTVYKLKLLRRYCESVLYFNVKRREEGVVMQQFIFSMAAGLSMLIAFWSQQKFGNFTTSFLVAMVLGYIVKDRLKELSREATYLRLSRYMFDFVCYLKSDLIKNRSSVGTVKEVVQFVKFRKLDKAIKLLFKKNQLLNKEDIESVLVYKRQYKDLSSEMPVGIEQYADFVIFNLRKMLRNTSYQDYSYYYKKNNKVVCRKVPRNYAIDLIIKVSDDEHKNYQHHTIRVNHKGIRKISRNKINQTGNTADETDTSFINDKG